MGLPQPKTKVLLAGLVLPGVTRQAGPDTLLVENGVRPVRTDIKHKQNYNAVE
jgi:hypothetical protein